MRNSKKPVSRGKIPPLKISGRPRFDMCDIEKWLKEKKVEVSDIDKKAKEFA